MRAQKYVDTAKCMRTDKTAIRPISQNNYYLTTISRLHLRNHSERTYCRPTFVIGEKSTQHKVIAHTDFQ